MTLRRRWLLAVIAAAALGAAGGIAYAAIPDGGGVIHTCYTKSSGAWRVIDTGLGQTCKSNEAALDLYSKGGADLAFLNQAEADGLYLGRTAKAADSEKLDGQDSTAFLGATATAADSDKLDGKDSTDFLESTATAADSNKLGGRPAAAYLLTNGGFVLTDAANTADGLVSSFGCCLPADPTPSITFTLHCATSGGTTLVASAPESFRWWWNLSAGEALPVGSGYEAEFVIANGISRNSLRATPGNTTTILDLDLSIGATCQFGWTVLKSVNASPGP